MHENNFMCKMDFRSSFLILIIGLSGCNPAKRNETKILVYYETTDAEIEERLRTLEKSQNLIYTSNADYFQEDSLHQFSSIFIPFSALNNLDYKSLTAIKRYFEAGGGGVASVRDTLLTRKEWPWLQRWNDLQTGRELKQDAGNFTILGPKFTANELQNAISWSIGSNALPDYTRATTNAVPLANRYSYEVLAQGMDEPMQMAILPNDDVLLVERKGAVKFYSDSAKEIKTIANFNVFSGIEDGLLGVAIDPDFEHNNWVYFYYAVAGEKAINRLSRMEFKDNILLRTTEKTLLEIPTQRQYCCHSAGYLQFGPDGLLYLSTGDNTNAEDTDGYIPIDERPGRELADDQATAANTNDLRGKILRIKPEADGTYSIPDGNLFPKGTPRTRPEIYTMGSRNPYRFSVDMKNGFVYFGDVGPDTKVPSPGGTLSYDEVNQARKPGFFGWPYFLGNNEAFPHYDFATKKEGPKFNALEPLNNSPNNTGLKELPPAQPAMIWYADGISTDFPLVGKGGESAMAGPVYYSEMFPNAPYKLSAYYDGKLFIYDWVRRWFMAVTFDSDMNYLRMEPFLDHIKFTSPTDMKFASNGSLYILEYGTNWFAKNSDAKLIRLQYTVGNRKPVANITASSMYGASPFTVDLSANASTDYDEGDKLDFNWLIEGKHIDGEKISYTFEAPGIYQVALTAADNHGESNTSTLDIKVGNTPPEVNILTTGNRTFYWDNTALKYRIEISDREDETIDTGKVLVDFTYLSQGKDAAVALSNPQVSANLQYFKGQTILDNLDCKACHTLSEPSAGPSYQEIAERYSGQTSIVGKLTEKIIQGGSGNWGERVMSSHPDLSEDEATEIVNYILSLSGKTKTLPLDGLIPLKDHVGDGNEGSYLFVVHYTDQGANEIEPLSTQSHVVLRNPLVQVEEYDETNISLRTVTTEFLTYAAIRDQNFIRFNDVDLKSVKRISYRLQKQGVGGKIYVRLDGMDGPVVSEISIPPGKSRDIKEGWAEIASPVKNTTGKHDLYFLFSNENEPGKMMLSLDWLYFSNK